MTAPLVPGSYWPFRSFPLALDAGAHRYTIANSYRPTSPGTRQASCSATAPARRARGIRTVDWGVGDSGCKQVLGATAAAAVVDRLLAGPGLLPPAAELRAPCVWRARCG